MIENLLFEKVTSLSTVTKLLELLQIELAASIFVDYIEELSDVCEGYLYSMLLKHRLQLFCVE